MTMLPSGITVRSGFDEYSVSRGLWASSKNALISLRLPCLLHKRHTGWIPEPRRARSPNWV